MNAVLIYLAISNYLSSGIYSFVGKNFFAEENADCANASPLFLKNASELRLFKHVYKSISEMKPSLSISM